MQLQQRHAHADQLHHQRQLRQASAAAACQCHGTATLTNCTISGNSASIAGGGLLTTALRTLTLVNTIVAGNTATIQPGPNVAGTFTSQGNNLIGKTDGSSGWVSSERPAPRQPLQRLLAPLGNYGGPTETMALLPGSPAIDAGTAVPASAPTSAAGRGSRRSPTSALSRARALRSRSSPAAPRSPRANDIAFANPLAVTVTANNPVEPVDGGVVTFIATRQWHSGKSLRHHRDDQLRCGQAVGHRDGELLGRFLHRHRLGRRRTPTVDFSLTNAFGLFALAFWESRPELSKDRRRDLF